jgi:hypothetical protein
VSEGPENTQPKTPKAIEKTKGEEEDDGILLICMRAGPTQRATVPGAALRECRDCHHPVWLAPTGQDMVRDKGAEVVCIPCAETLFKNDPDAKISMPTPEQMEEIERTLRWDQLRTFRGKTGMV